MIIHIQTTILSFINFIPLSLMNRYLLKNTDAGERMRDIGELLREAWRVFIGKILYIEAARQYTQGSVHAALYA